MRTKIIVALSVIVFIGLFQLSVAHAESWVLWTVKEITPTNLKNSVSWNIIDAYPDHNLCLQTKEKVWQAMKKTAIEAKAKYSTISAITEVRNKLILTHFNDTNKDITSISETLYCLPGTLDPREKK